MKGPPLAPGSRLARAEVALLRLLHPLLGPPRLLHLVLAATGLYALVLSLLAVEKLWALQTYAWDLGAYSQALHTTLFEGRFFYYTADLPNNPSGSIFGAHFAPVLFLLLPLYYLAPSPATLLVVQTVALALGAPVTYALARRRGVGEAPAAALALVYLVSPAVVGINWFDFHPEAFLPPLLLLAIYHWEARAWPRFWASLLLALATLEMAGAVVAGLGLQWLLALRGEARRGPGPLDRRRALIAAGLVALGAAWATVGVRLILLVNPGPALLAGGSPNWSVLGAASLPEVPLRALTDPARLAAALAYDGGLKLLFLVLLLGPFAFLPLRRPASLIPCVPWLALALVSNYRPYYLMGFQYPAFLVAPIVYGAVLGLQALGQRAPGPLAGWPPWARAALRPQRVLPVLGVAFLLLSTPVVPLAPGTSDIAALPRVGDHERALLALAALVPPGAPVLTQNNLFPLFADRGDSYVIPHASFFGPGLSFNGSLAGYVAGVDYILVDLRTSPAEAVAILARAADVPGFGVLGSADGGLLLARGFTGGPQLFAPWRAGVPAEGLALDLGGLVADPSALHGEALWHGAAAGDRFWTLPGLLLWPGDYTLVLRLRAVPATPETLLRVGVDLRPALLTVAELHAGARGYAVRLGLAYGACALRTALLEVPGAALPDPAAYGNVTLRFTADAFGLYTLVATPGAAVDLYVDEVALTQERPLPGLRLLPCP